MSDASRSLTAGMVFIAFSVGGALLGCATAQVIYYVRQYWDKDRLFLKVLVTTVWGLEIFHLGVFTASLHWTFVARRFLPNEIEFPWTSSAQLIINSTLTAIVQSFYIHRVWSLQRSVLLTTVLAIMTLGCWSIGATIMIVGLVTGNPGAPGLQRALSSALSATTAGSDILITTSLSILLVRSYTGSSRSTRLINRLLFYTINTGLLTSICSLLSLFTNIFAGQTNLYVLFYYCGARLYTNSMMASLNARQSLRDHMINDTGITNFEDFQVRNDLELESHPAQEPTLRLMKRSVHSFNMLFRKEHGPILPAHTPITRSTTKPGRASALHPDDDAVDVTFPYTDRVLR